MTIMRVLGAAMLAVCLVASVAMAADTDVLLKISGPGAVDSSTIKAGKPVSFDFYVANNKDGGRGFSTGFCIKSNDIKKIVHAADPAGGLSKEGDIKGYNGWENSDVWDLAGVWVPRADWDGNLPDTMAFAGAVIYARYKQHPMQKVLSWSIVVEDPGQLVVDSCFVRPGSVWQIIHVDNEGQRTETKPSWGGPYTFKVVK
jgi:hypothetical protein